MSNLSSSKTVSRSQIKRNKVQMNHTEFDGTKMGTNERQRSGLKAIRFHRTITMNDSGKVFLEIKSGVQKKKKKKKSENHCLYSFYELRIG